MVKVIFNDVKKGKSYQKEFEMELFNGKKIGDKISGDALGLKDYEFLITGASDNAGFPLSTSFESSVRKKILINDKGTKRRKAVRGNQFGDYIAQINMKVVKYGAGDLAKAFEAKEQVPAEQKKPKVEEKPVEKPKVEEKKE